MASIISNIVDMVGYFGDAAGAFPTSVILLLAGALFIVGSSAVLGYLTLGAVVDLLTPENVGRPPAQRQ